MDVNEQHKWFWEAKIKNKKEGIMNPESYERSEPGPALTVDLWWSRSKEVMILYYIDIIKPGTPQKQYPQWVY